MGMEVMREHFGEAFGGTVFMGVKSEIGLAWVVTERGVAASWDGWFPIPDRVLVDLREVAPLDWVGVAGGQLRPFLRAVGLHDFDPIPGAGGSTGKRVGPTDRLLLEEAALVTYLVLTRGH